MQLYDYTQYMPTMPAHMMTERQTIPIKAITASVMPGMMMPGQYLMSQCMPWKVDIGPYIYPQNLPGALQLIRGAVAGEREDRLFYEYLINNAPSEEDKEIIRGIRDNEIKHFDMFKQIYCELTGQPLPPPQEVPFEQPASYCAGIKKAIMGEQGAVQRYRRILFALQNRVHINMLTEIITDELRHGILYNYLYSRNACRI